MEKRILIVQIRTDQKIKEHDAAAYCRVLGNSVSYDIRNIIDEEISPDELENYTAVIVGGSHFMPEETFPHKEALYSLVGAACERGMSFLGICFGFQVLTQVLGGEVVRDKAKKEFGSYDLGMTEAGEKDPLFEGISNPFVVQHAHEAYVTKTPAEAVVLATSPLVPVQAFRIKNTHIYGVQFHPEMSKEDMHERMDMYNKSTIGTYFFPQDAFDSVRDSRSSEEIVRNFVRIALS